MTLVAIYPAIVTAVYHKVENMSITHEYWQMAKITSVTVQTIRMHKCTSV